MQFVISKLEIAEVAMLKVAVSISTITTAVAPTQNTTISCSLVQRQRELLASGGRSYGSESDLQLPHLELTGKTMGNYLFN